VRKRALGAALAATMVLASAGGAAALAQADIGGTLQWGGQVTHYATFRWHAGGQIFLSLVNMTSNNLGLALRNQAGGQFTQEALWPANGIRNFKLPGGAVNIPAQWFAFNGRIAPGCTLPLFCDTDWAGHLSY
jgi:hypothetical protein